MGLLKDALALGHITLDEYEEMQEEWSVYGYNASVMGDTGAFQAMAEDLEARGIDDLAAEAWNQVEESMYYYAALNEFQIYYDSDIGRWRWESGTEKAGQFTYNPYEQVRV